MTLKIQDLLNENKLPINDKCKVSGEMYYVGKTPYSVELPISKFKQQLVDRKAVMPDFKAASHGLRAGYQLKEIYETGDLQYPLKKAKFLLEVKQGQHDYSTVVAPTLEALVDEVELLAAKSRYPEKVDREWWNNFIVRAYK